MFKFSMLLISIVSISLVAHISVELLYQDLFEKRFPSKSYKNSLFYHYKRLNTSAEDPIPQSNDVYTYTFPSLNIDSTTHLNFSSLSCRPISFGYSIEQGSKVFPDFTYPDCSEVTGVDFSKATIDRINNKLSINCKHSNSPFFFSGPVAGRTLMKKDDVYMLEIQKYSSELNAENIEFVLADCSSSEKNLKKTEDFSEFLKKNKKKTEFEHAAMVPEFNEQLLNEYKSKVNGKPKIIFLLTLDSMSRRHFFRKLPNVVKFLNNSKNFPDHHLYDFKLHSTFGSDTTHNQGPLLGGKDYWSRRSRGDGDKLGYYSMWSKMKEKGFITMMGTDDCDGGFPNVFGNNVKVDFSVRQFFCLINVYSGVKSAKNETEQRCVGPYQSHFYVLNYTLQLVKDYKESNLWIYHHLNAAHEKTGQHAATLNKDLTWFLKEFFKEAENSELFMYIGADHGMRYGNWYNSIDAYQETKLPSMFLIASKTWLQRFPYSFHALEENSARLTTKTDLRETFLSLIEEEENEPWAYNLLETIVPFSRECQDLQSNILFCACSPMRLISKFNSTVKHVIHAIRERVEDIVNKKSYFFHKFPPGKHCDYIKIGKILRFYHMEVNNQLEVFKIEFGSNVKKGFRLEVNALIGSKASLVNEDGADFKGFNFAIAGYKYRIRVICR